MRLWNPETPAGKGSGFTSEVRPPYNAVRLGVRLAYAAQHCLKWVETAPKQK